MSAKTAKLILTVPLHNALALTNRGGFILLAVNGEVHDDLLNEQIGTWEVSNES